MSKEQCFELLEKNLKEWKETKESGEPCMDNFTAYCMCFYPLIFKLEFEFEENPLTKEETERLASIRKRIEEIKKIPANYIQQD